MITRGKKKERVEGAETKRSETSAITAQTQTSKEKRVLPADGEALEGVGGEHLDVLLDLGLHTTPMTRL